MSRDKDTPLVPERAGLVEHTVEEPSKLQPFGGVEPVVPEVLPHVGRTGKPRRPTINVQTRGRATRIRDDIEDAYEQLGGVSWLVDLGRAEPKEFAKLLGKLLPKDVQVEHKSKTLEELVALASKRERELIAEASQGDAA